MKWFKHYSDATDDEFLALVEAEFGLEGLARWWLLLETVAKQLKPGATRAACAYPVNKWCSFLRCKPKKLDSFLELTGNESKTNQKQTGNVLEIEIPNLLKLRDEYSRKSGHSPGNVAQEKEKEKEKDIPPYIPPRGEPSDKVAKKTKPKYPRSDDEWMKYGNRHGVNARVGEPMFEYVRRLRAHWNEQKGGVTH